MLKLEFPGLSIIIVAFAFVACEGERGKPANGSGEIVTDEPIDLSYQDSLIKKHQDFLQSFEIEAGLNPNKGMHGFRVYRYVLVEPLEKDTLSYWTDWSRWNFPDSTTPDDRLFWFEWKIAFSDIDTSRISYDRKGDLLWVKVPSKDTSMARWSKYYSETGQKLWEAPSDEVRFAILTSLEKIKKNFTSYQMYAPDLQKRVDYVKTVKDSVSAVKIFNHVKRKIIEYTSKNSR